jgi:diguanylate cyclase (GGDEF)-like protein
LGFVFHAYVDRSLSYYQRMRTYNQELQQLASRDPLTGVMNARAYYAACEQQIQLCRRLQRPFAVLFVDLDHFKRINDGLGHAAGDEVLRTVARALKDAVRSSDLLGRIGGEEFSMLLPDTDAAGAVQLAESVRQAVEASRPSVGGSFVPVTASVGVAVGRDPGATIKAIQEQADQAMYHAKQAGRNRVSLLEHAVAGYSSQP